MDEEFFVRSQLTMAEVAEELRNFGERGLLRCARCRETTYNMLYSSTDVPYRREGEIHYAIREHHGNCNILLKRYSDNPSDDYFCPDPLCSMEQIGRAHV